MPIYTTGRRRSIAREAVAFDTSGRGSYSYEAPAAPAEEPVDTEEKLLITADLVDVYGVSVFGTATMVDNVPLEPGMRVLRNAPGGSLTNGVWTVPDPITDDWVRYKPELLKDGLRVVITNGAEAADTATAPNSPFGGYRETVWQLATHDPIVVESTAIEFLQAPIADGASSVKTGLGVIAVPAFPGIALGLAAFHPHCDGLFITPAFGIGAVRVDYSGLYWTYFSILCGHVATGGTLAGGIFRNGALEKEVFRDVITTADERHKGGTLVRLVGDNQDAVTFRIWDPAGVGFSINATDLYADIHIVARR